MATWLVAIRAAHRKRIIDWAWLIAWCILAPLCVIGFIEGVW